MGTGTLAGPQFCQRDEAAVVISCGGRQPLSYNTAPGIVLGIICRAYRRPRSVAHGLDRPAQAVVINALAQWAAQALIADSGMVDTLPDQVKRVSRRQRPRRQREAYKQKKRYCDMSCHCRHRKQI